MAKQITTLIQDIYSYLDGKAKLEPSAIKALGDRLASTIAERLSDGDKDHNQLRMSNFGTKCDRQLWYTIRTPEAAEPLEPAARFKFLFGDIIEEVALFMAEEAGHSIEGRQDTLEVHGVQGHRDVVIDGVLVDVKSASPIGFTKFQDHKLNSDDPFGYLDQINLYLEASKSDPKVTVKGEAAFLAIDKVHGNMVLDRYKKEVRDWEAEIKEKREVINADNPPERAYQPVPFGKSGNKQLPMPCRYCSFKHTCHPGLRTFKYSNGNVHLTSVVRPPDVEEIT